ncbi:peptidoglycan-binding domain-containing protein [Mangrovicella endophytica]|uniref:peptidoglycan-binding domain-containing protein n=1 Tax=Mangrovicella endophytica TaxID=2066697 RepID=UPI0018E436C4|nr:peptidoglycan-binding protein [Mangrovicella endophytica]
MRRPLLSGGVAAFTALFGCLTVNALYAQPGRHPSPLLATRLDASGSFASRWLASGEDAATMPVPLVREVQAALAETGHYAAVVDGRPGPATTAAIKAYQSEIGVRADGQVSPVLLSQIRARAGGQAGGKRSSETQRVASLDERMGSDETGTIAPARRAAAVPAQAKGSAALSQLPKEELVRRIQSGLTSAQVATLQADGIVGEQTRAAIRTFEALEGLDVTGTPQPRILQRLIDIGAVN